MIFERAARREFAQAASGIGVALLAILLSTQLIRLLKEAAGGKIAPEAVASLLGFATLNFIHATMMVIRLAANAIQKGVCGEMRSHSWAPIHGMGRDRTPSDVPKKPNASPRFDSGTTFEISD